MAYSAGMLDERIIIQNRSKAEGSDFGLEGDGVYWDDCCAVWASVEWAKGMRAMNAGSLDVYGVVIVRMRWCGCINMRSRIRWQCQTYQILPETFHADKRANTIQFHAQAIVEDVG